MDSTLTKARQLAADNKPDFETCITEPVPKSLDANIFVLGIIPICLGLAEAAPEKAEADFAELAQAMISATKHSQELYIGPAHFENAKAFRASVGLSLRKDDRGIIVVGANASAPAGRGGIKKGDRLIAVNETLVSDLTLDDTVELLRGEAGSSVKLTFADGNGHQQTILLNREQIKPDHALVAAREGDRLMVSIHSMPEDLTDLLAEEIAAKSAGVRMLVLDLRGNTGGLLYSAVDVADSFLGKGVIAKQVDKGGVRETYKANRRALLPGVEMFVLVDSDTASGAELVAAALADNGRARVIGKQTAAVGMVRTMMLLGPQRVAILTTQSLLRPNGAPIEKNGVTPDCEIDPTLFDLAAFQGCSGPPPVSQIPPT